MDDLIARKALIEELKNLRFPCVLPSGIDYLEGVQTAVRAITDVINSAPVASRWIPCSERMPNEAGEYLVCGKWNGEKSKTWICRFIISGDIGGFVNSAKNPPVSFWMPMPDAYEPPESEVQK